MHSTLLLTERMLGPDDNHIPGPTRSARAMSIGRPASLLQVTIDRYRAQHWIFMILKACDKLCVRKKNYQIINVVP